MLIGALSMQFAAAVMLVVGLLSLTELLIYPLSAVGYYAIAGSWLLVGASWCAVELRARWWRRRSSQSRDHAKPQDREDA